MSLPELPNTDGPDAPDTEPVATGRRRGITIYPASKAVNNNVTGFRGEGRSTPEVNAVMQDLLELGYKSGVKSMCLFRQSEEEGGYSAVLVWGKPNYPLPRHSHMSDCMYFVISGSATMGTRGPAQRGPDRNRYDGDVARRGGAVSQRDPGERAAMVGNAREPHPVAQP
jgi:mannose-6-phosphate isomerase-like protein (cupin superfamily)